MHIAQRIVLTSLLWTFISMHPAIHIRITTNDNQTFTLDAKHPIVCSSSTLQYIIGEINDNDEEIFIPLKLDVSTDALTQFIAFVTRPEHAALLIDLTTSSSSSWQDDAKVKKNRENLAFSIALQAFQQRSTNQEDIALSLDRVLLPSLIYIADHLALDGPKHLLEYEAAQQLTSANALEMFLHNDAEHATLRAQLATHTSEIGQKMVALGRPQDFMYLDNLIKIKSPLQPKSYQQGACPIFLSACEQRMAFFGVKQYKQDVPILSFYAFNNNNQSWIPSEDIKIKQGKGKEELDRGLFLANGKRFLLCTLKDTSSDNSPQTILSLFLFTQNNDGNFANDIKVIRSNLVGSSIPHIQNLAANHDGSIIIMQAVKSARFIVYILNEGEWNQFLQSRLTFEPDAVSVDYHGNWVAISDKSTMQLFKLDREKGELVPRTGPFEGISYSFSNTLPIMITYGRHSKRNMYIHNEETSQWELSSKIPGPPGNIHINDDISQIAVHSVLGRSKVFTKIYRKSLDQDDNIVWSKSQRISDCTPCFSSSGKMFASTDNNLIRIGCLNNHTSKLEEFSFALKDKIATVKAINNIGTIVTEDGNSSLFSDNHTYLYQLRPFASNDAGYPSLDQALLLALAGNYRAQGKKLILSDDHLTDILKSFGDNAKDYLINKTNLVLPPLDSWCEPSCSTSTAIKNSLHVLTDTLNILTDIITDDQES